MKTLSQIREASGGKEAYQKFFNSLLKKFGVDSPSELSGDKKKKFFNAVDKGWEGDDPGDANEATIHIPFQKSLNEKLKPGKGKEEIGADVDWDNVGDEKKWIKQAKSKYKVTIKKDIGKYHSGMTVTGEKANIIKFLQGPMYGGVEDRDIEDMWPWLLENKDDFKSDTDVDDDEGNYSGVDEASRFSRELRGPAKQIFLKTLEKIKKEKIKGDKDQAAAIDDIDGAQHLNGHDKRTIISALKYESHDDFKDDSDVDDDEGNYSGVNEVKPPKLGDKEEYYRRVDKVDAKFKIGYGKGKRSMSDLSSAELKKYFAARDKALGHDIFDSVQEKAPPGMENVVKKLKQDHSDEEAFAIAWSMHNDKKRREQYYSEAVQPYVKDDDVEEAKWGPVKKGKTIRGAKLGKSYPVMNQGQRRKIIAIAKKHSGNMQQAIKDIEKLKKGMTDNPAVMDILRQANEKVDCDARILGFKAALKRKEGIKQKGKVIVDRRTKGYKEAEVRREIAKAKREAKKEAKKPTIDPMYGEDATPEIKAVIMNSRKMMEEPANSVADGGVDMAPNAGKKKKFKVVKRANY
tara:strand:- start:2702 stop:4423 length:1722 start_codon:yes stop_codon:yes gene_type:complete